MKEQIQIQEKKDAPNQEVAHESPPQGNEEIWGCLGITVLILAVIGIIYLWQGCSDAPKLAMRRAISYDKSISRQVYKDSSLLEVLFGANPEKTAAYVRNLKKTPLGDCPEDFRKAYKKHIAAWESRNKSLIDSTFHDVLATAKLHGVDYE